MSVDESQAQRINEGHKEYRIRALTCVLLLGGMVGVVDPLMTFWYGVQFRSIIAFLTGCVLLSLVPFLRRTGAIRTTVAIAMLACSSVFLGNFAIYGEPYFFAVGFAIPLTAALFLSAREAVIVLVAYSLASLGIAWGLQNELWRPPFVGVPRNMLFQLTFNGVLVIVAVSVSTIWKERLLSLTTESELIQQRRLKTILNNGYGALLETDEAGNVIYVAGPFIKRLGYEAAELHGRHQLEFLAREDRRILYRTTATDGGHFKYDREVRILDADGGLRWVRISGGTFSCEDGSRKWVNAFQDIEEQVKHRERVFEMSRMESLGNICGGLAHDFNNLLTVIGIQGEMIRDDDIRQQIQNAQRQAADLTAGLLTFARKHKFRSQRIQLDEFLKGTRPLIERLVPANIPCRWVLESDYATVHIDPDQLRQVLINLVTNSQHAMPNGGTLTIKTSIIEVLPDEVLDECHRNECVALEVTDTGAGMDAATSKRAIEPFFTTKPRGKGTGLGLATVHGVIHRAGGTIRINSLENVGTSIVVLLPFSDAMTSADEAETSIPPAARVQAKVAMNETHQGPLPHVLLVEDRVEVGKTIRKIFELERFTVSNTTSAETAWDLLQSGGIDLVVSDVVLPGISGADLAQRIIESQPTTKVILISGYQPQELEIVNEHPHRVRFLPKPFSRLALVEASRKLLSEHAAV